MRTREGGLAAHYNVCRHRGSQLVPDGERGHFSGGIRCPYHSWTYTLDGALRTAPFLEESDGLAKGDLSLHPVGVDTWGGFVFVNLTPGEAEQRETLACRAAGWSSRAPSALSPGRAPGRAADRVFRSGELEGDAGELQRVLPLRPGAPGAVPAGAGLQAAGRRRSRLGAGHPASRRRVDLHRQRHDHPGAVRRLERGRARPAQGRADLSQLPAEPLGRPRGRLHHPPPRPRPDHRGLRVPLPSRRDGEGRLRPLRRGGLLGPGEPAGLGHLRVGAAGNELASVPDRLLRADGELEPGHPEVCGGEDAG